MSDRASTPMDRDESEGNDLVDGLGIPVKGLPKAGRGPSVGGTQQAGVSGLLKVAIGCEGLPDAVLSHDHKADAVGEAPRFVRAAPVKLPASGKRPAIDRNDGDAAGGAEGVDKADRRLPERRPGERVRDFGQHRLGREVVRARGEELVMSLDRRPMEPVSPVGQRQPRARVSKHGPGHDTGVPYR